MKKWRILSFRGEEYDDYLVYEDGAIFSKKKQMYLKVRPNRRGYLYIHLPSLPGVNCYIHQIVAESFIAERISSMTVDHVDGDKTNNHYSNLEYVTNLENHRRARKMGLYSKEAGTHDA